MAWLQHWLDSRLLRAASSLDHAAYSDDDARRDALFDAAISQARFPFKLLLRRLKHHAAEMGVTPTHTPPLPPHVAEELVDYASELDDNH